MIKSNSQLLISSSVLISKTLQKNYKTKIANIGQMQFQFQIDLIKMKVRTHDNRNLKLIFLLILTFKTAF